MRTVAAKLKTKLDRDVVARLYRKAMWFYRLRLVNNAHAPKR